MDDVLLIDVSKWQDNNDTVRKIDFGIAKERGVVGVFVKATQYIKDPDFDDYWRDAKEVGLPRGAYHFAYYSKYKSAKKQAEFLWNTIKHDPGELPPVLDFETRDGIGLSWIKLFLETLKTLSGRVPILYTGISVWNELRDSDNAVWILDYPLWISYPNNKLPAPVRGIPDEIVSPVFKDGSPALPNIWRRKKVPQFLWQFSYVGDGAYYGMESKGLDMNKFNGTMAEYLSFVNGTPDEPPTSSLHVVVTANFLRFRPLPLYENTKTLIVEQGQVLEIAGSRIFEESSGITWLPVFAPSKYDGSIIGFVSADKEYIKYL